MNKSTKSKTPDLDRDCDFGFEMEVMGVPVMIGAQHYVYWGDRFDYRIFRTNGRHYPWMEQVIPDSDHERILDMINKEAPYRMERY